jgi:small-conductance mechanosensitive channel
MAFDPAVFLLEHDLAGAIVIFLSAFLLGKIINLFLKRIVSVFTAKTKTTLDDDLVRAIKKPLFYLILLFGLNYALLSIVYLESHSSLITKITTVLAIVILFFLIKRVINAIVKWYSYELYPRIKRGTEYKNLTIFNKVFDILLFLIFLVIVLRYLGVEITALVASLGIGGLAVALALQQTLGDLIAGVSIIGDKSLRIGDYVEFENGLGGYIDDVSWRTSRIKTLGNNYVIIPNTQLAQSIATDYSFGTTQTSIGVTIYVSYRNDLDKVEKIAKRLQRRSRKPSRVRPEAKSQSSGSRSSRTITSWPQSISINSFTDKWLVKHEYMKRLKKAFEKNHIEISYPTREIIMRKKR